MSDLATRTARQELETVLDPAHAQAVIDHRQKLKKPLTERAAALLAAQFKNCRDPNAAADEMILRGWRGFKPDWMKEPSWAGGKATYSVHRPPTKIPDDPQISPDERERMIAKCKALSAQLGAVSLMDHPRHVQQRDRGR